MTDVALTVDLRKCQSALDFWLLSTFISLIRNLGLSIRLRSGHVTTVATDVEQTDPNRWLART